MSQLEQSAVSLDWGNCPLVEIDPLKVSGVPILKGTRMPVEMILENYRDGLQADEIAEVFELPPDGVRDLISYAAQRDPTLQP